MGKAAVQETIGSRIGRLRKDKGNDANRTGGGARCLATGGVGL